MKAKQNDVSSIYTSDLCDLVVIPTDLLNKIRANFSEVQTAVFITIYHFSSDHPESAAILTLDEFSDFLFISKVLVNQAIHHLKESNVIFEIIPAKGHKTGKYMINKCMEDWKVRSTGQAYNSSRDNIDPDAGFRRKKGGEDELGRTLGN